jgi:hypothetical protein
MYRATIVPHEIILKKDFLQYLLGLEKWSFARNLKTGGVNFASLF